MWLKREQEEEEEQLLLQYDLPHWVGKYDMKTFTSIRLDKSLQRNLSSMEGII